MRGGERAPAVPHIKALDGARGVAVAGVLLFHGGHLDGGYLGVDFFFTLSGFLITSLLLAEVTRTGAVGLGGFWARRARRLLPALAVLLVGIIVYSAVLATPDQLAQIRGDGLATMFYVANWREIFSHQNYFALFSAPSPLNHTWSLAIEEQFYLLWPLAFVALLAWWKRRTPYAVLVGSLTLAALSTTLMIVLYDPANVARDYYGTDTRATAILLGCALAAWLAIHGPTRQPSRRIALELFGIVGIVVLAIAWTRLDGQSGTLYHGGFLACAIAATGIIAAAAHPTRGPINRVLSFAPICALGLISYGVYLYHWPLDVVLTPTRTHLNGWPLFALQTIAALVIAYVSYRCIEQPIRRGTLAAVPGRKLTAALAAGLTAAIVIALLATTNTAENATTNTAVPNSPKGYVYPPPAFAINAAARAFRTSPPGARRVLIVGDSVAYYLGQAFEGLRPARPITVFSEGNPLGCAFYPGARRVRYRNAAGIVATIHTDECDPAWQAQVVRHFRPTIAFWIVSNPADAYYVKGRWVNTCSAAYTTDYERQLRKEVSLLGASGARVVMITEVYPRYTLADVDHQTDCDNQIRRSVAATTRVQLVDLQNYICPDGHCREKQDGITLRVDGEHYEGAGGLLVARWLLDQVH